MAQDTPVEDPAPVEEVVVTEEEPVVTEEAFADVIPQVDLTNVLPKDCDRIVMGQATAIFCPAVKYLISTDELMSKGFENSQNYWQSYFSTADAINTVNLSYESEFKDALVLLVNEDEIWRVSRSEEQYKLNVEFQFSINAQYEVLDLILFDTYAVVHFADQSFYVAVRPTNVDEVAIYARAPQENGATSTSSFLFLSKTPVMSHSYYVDAEGRQIMSILIKIDFATTRQLQFMLDVNIAQATAEFAQKTTNDLEGLPPNQITSYFANDRFFTVGCQLCIGQNGTVSIYAQSTFEEIATISGIDLGLTHVGKQIEIQYDEIPDNHRIWFVTNETVEAGVLFINSAGDVEFHSNFVKQEQKPNSPSALQIFEGRVLFISTPPTGQSFLGHALPAFTACESGLSYVEPVDGNLLGTCSKCDPGFYSYGVDEVCTECSVLEQVSTKAGFFGQTIDKQCENSKTIDDIIQTVRQLSAGAIVAIILLCTFVLLILIFFNVVLCCRRLKCCAPISEKYACLQWCKQRKDMSNEFENVQDDSQTSNTNANSVMQNSQRFRGAKKAAKKDEENREENVEKLDGSVGEQQRIDNSAAVPLGSGVKAIADISMDNEESPTKDATVGLQVVDQSQEQMEDSPAPPDGGKVSTDASHRRQDSGKKFRTNDPLFDDADLNDDPSISDNRLNRNELSPPAKQRLSFGVDGNRANQGRNTVFKPVRTTEQAMEPFDQGKNVPNRFSLNEINLQKNLHPIGQADSGVKHDRHFRHRRMESNGLKPRGNNDESVFGQSDILEDDYI